MARFDLSDDQWLRIQPHLPPERPGKRGRPYLDHRIVINGILWGLRTGSPWRDMPELYGSCKTCYDRFIRWRRDGIWQRALEAVQAQVDANGNIDWDVFLVDASIVKAHPHAAGARRLTAKPLKKGERSMRVLASCKKLLDEVAAASQQKCIERAINAPVRSQLLSAQDRTMTADIWRK